MIIDLNERDSTEPIECDICVVGSGPAAFSLALSFADKPVRVYMLESGGFDRERKIQGLYQGESVGYALANGLAGSRSRFFGGSSNCWAGVCTLLDTIDFKVRDWVPYSGWPIGPEALEPYYDAAQKVCLSGPSIYDERLLDKLPERQFAFKPDSLQMGYWQFGEEPRLGKYYRRQFSDSRNITVVLHSTVTEIAASPDANHVLSLTAQSLQGRKASVKAKAYVLACGGIENARLLLASNRVQPEGLGNANDMVGRFFLEHPVIVSATVVPKIKGDLRLDFLNVFHEPPPRFQGTRFNVLIKTTEAFQRRHRILNSALFVVDHDAEFSEGLMAAVRLRQALHERRFPEDFVREVLSVLEDFPNVATAAYGRYVNYGSNRTRLGLKIQAETVPNPDSRVTLSHKHDAFGAPLAKLDWKLAELDRRTMDVIVDEISSEFSRLGLATIERDKWMTENPDAFPDDMRGGVHHSGTTKMSSHPKDGVVDVNCRMHAVDNLYIAGSSVFPTNSWANPTLTISCMAIRLADHLDNRLRAVH
jgi:choline dehydrogenase-like flavoprotein